jgi:SAM-dependent methyltransferase
MPSFQHRSYQKELLDGDAIPFAAIEQNMKELNVINTLLGGHHITIQGVKALLHQHNKKQWRITEIGCGGGDNLRAIKRWAEEKTVHLSLTGIDINKECIAFAKQLKENTGIDFIASDYKNIYFQEQPDILFSSLFCHHFSEEELIEQLQWMHRNSTIGFFINDLHRHPFAYYSIKGLTWLFSRSYLVKNDAPLSVLRGFRRKEWKDLFQQAGLPLLQCHWRWAFRWLITGKK